MVFNFSEIYVVNIDHFVLSAVNITASKRNEEHLSQRAP